MARSVVRAAAMGVSLLILLAATCQADNEGNNGRKKIAACPPKKGYTTLANMAWSYGGVSNNGKKTHGSAATAEAACTADSSCMGFNYNGASIKVGDITGVQEVPGVCSYVKKKCPVKAGYTAIYGFVWTLGAGGVESVAPSVDVAEATCTGLDLCSGFNSLGKYVVGEISGEAPSPVPICSYWKNDCPERYGYTAYPNTALEAVTGEDGVATGQLSGLDEAADFCKLEFRCSGFSNDGSYYIGGVADLVPSPGVCSYVKDSCAPMAGFTVYADANLVREAYDGRQSAKCFTEVYKACKDDPTCKAFNNLRYIWSTVPEKHNLDSQLNDATGVCFYVKIEETAGGSIEGDADR